MVFVRREMKPGRLDALADGIFAIVMTLLVIEFRVPEVEGVVTNASLWDSLSHYGPLVMSYILSFAVLFAYWRAHHYLMGVYAKNVDVHLMNINAVFFLFTALIPFSTAVLGHYHTTQVAIMVYSVNVILIGLSLWWMRQYVLYTDHIDNVHLSDVELRHGTIRTVVPVVVAAIAMPLSFMSPTVSLTLLTLAVLFNLLPHSTHVVDGVMGYNTDK